VWVGDGPATLRDVARSAGWIVPSTAEEETAPWVQIVEPRCMSVRGIDLGLPEGLQAARRRVGRESGEVLPGQLRLAAGAREARSADREDALGALLRD